MRYLILVFTLFTLTVYSQNEVVQFPYFVDFQSTIVPTGIYVPEPASNTVEFTKDGLVFTKLAKYSTGTVLLQDLSFSPKDGIEISFEYNIYGGNDADGIILFLYDGSIPNDKIHTGAVGRSMGYAPNRAAEKNKGLRKKGLPGAYLGIAINTGANFKRLAFSEYSRLIGIAPPPGEWPNEGKSHITLRGAALDLPESDPYNGYRGYPVLTTKGTLLAPYHGLKGSATLQDDGNYTFGSSLLQWEAFPLKGNKLTTNDHDPEFRKAFVRLVPHVNGGFNVSVIIQHGKTLTPVIENFHYKESIQYYENADAVGGDFVSPDSDLRANGVLTTLNSKAPKTIKLGFAGITGDDVDNQLIRNLSIALPYGAKANDVNLDVCDNTATTLNALEGGLAYGGSYLNPTASIANIDKASFQFHDGSGNPVANAYVYEDTKGKWTYNPQTGTVNFAPKAGFKNSSTEIRYTFKGKTAPFNENNYRSNPAVIKLDALECPVYVNPSLQSRRL